MQIVAGTCICNRLDTLTAWIALLFIFSLQDPKALAAGITDNSNHVIQHIKLWAHEVLRVFYDRWVRTAAFDALPLRRRASETMHTVI